ncbi:hypothetical protein B0T17DRAFT_404903 [Bombardia bombarda]|uniref:F-box domain-containing protein n=1 Tax=Bombardia bombarda TaxID=252184 RepID=A0AA39WAP5_9PEZI|nr:hypothetical protein B0T17DRAFT_404903 [Bombardia bombarda]
MANHLERLPLELLIMIVEECEPHDLLSFSTACRKFYQVLERHRYVLTNRIKAALDKPLIPLALHIVKFLQFRWHLDIRGSKWELEKEIRSFLDAHIILPCSQTDALQLPTDLPTICDLAAYCEHLKSKHDHPEDPLTTMLYDWHGCAFSCTCIVTRAKVTTQEGLFVNSPSQNGQWETFSGHFANWNPGDPTCNALWSALNITPGFAPSHQLYSLLRREVWCT